MTLKKSFFYFFPPTLWAVFILVICLIPAREIPSVGLFQADKIVHIAVYFILTWLFYSSFQKNKINLSPYHFFLLITTIIGYGFFIEIAQELFTTDRHFDMWDAVANGLGTVLFIIAKQFV